MSMITVSHLTFCYEGSYDNIFDDVSFLLDTNWKLGFTGRNGKGKTTFLNLLLGKYEYRGTITSSVAFDYFPFAVSDRSLETRSVVLEVCPELEEWRLFKELSLLELSVEALDRPFDTLSNGERTKILLAALFLRDNRFLLIDEPTNHLDRRARETVARYLAGKSGFILVSHDRAFLDQSVDHILSINKTNIEVQKGNYSSWAKNKALRDSFELAENEKLKKEVDRLTEASRRAAAWSDRVEKTKKGSRNSGLRPDRGYLGHQAAKMMKRSKSTQARREQAVEEKSKLLKDIEESEPLRLHPLERRAGKLVEVLDLSISYHGRMVCEDLSFSVRGGERMALLGKNGCGKTSIMKLLLGEEIPHTGHVRLASGLVISYLAQDTSFLKGGLKDYAEAQGLDEGLFKAILRKLDFSRIQFEKRMEDYSEGQKKKVLLARSLCTPAHLYLWDEPLNFIDVLSRVQIEELILNSGPTMLFVEHDAAFCDRVATHTFLCEKKK